ncbi:o-methyltransferase [Lecanosticta acicola]|uniref:O-methyltransferase n=1 Tax=Lecanosticta acicola TaxID=111012 RepID=A0AAI8YV93_9PEZI|nr:o-methyltransferase [Lecanosticta acicola]
MADMLRELADNLPLDPQELKAIHDAAQKLVQKTETYRDIVARVRDGSMSSMFAHVAMDLSIFRKLAAQPEHVYSIGELADVTKADGTLLLRLLRYLASESLIQQVDEDSFKASRKTFIYAEYGTDSLIRCQTLVFAPFFNGIPAFFAANGYQNITDGKETVWQHSFGTDLGMFDWIRERPEELRVLHEVMQASRADQPSWVEKVPLDAILGNSNSDRTLFVDIGAGTGHQSMALRKRYPHLKGRVIIEDLPQVIDLLDQRQLRCLNIETLEHDFFTAQPSLVHGAKAYYLCQILHDWADTDCLTILKQIRSVMAEDSLLLLDDLVVPNIGATAKICAMDLLMMTSLAGQERSETQWEELLAEAGFGIQDIWRVWEETGNCLVVCVPV